MHRKIIIQWRKSHGKQGLNCLNTLDSTNDQLNRHFVAPSSLKPQLIPCSLDIDVEDEIRDIGRYSVRRNPSAEDRDQNGFFDNPACKIGNVDS